MKRIKNSIEYQNSLLLDKYKDIKFSQDFYDRYENSDWSVDSMKLLKLKELDSFIKFYDRYNPDGFRINNGVDLYKVSKEEYNKLMGGETFVDKVLGDPDNVLRNTIKLMFLDKHGLVNRK